MWFWENNITECNFHIRQSNRWSCSNSRCRYYRDESGELSDFRSQKLGFIFQYFNILENLSIYENIALPLSLQGIPSRKIRIKVEKVAEMLGISSYFTEVSI